MIKNGFVNHWVFEHQGEVPERRTPWRHVSLSSTTVSCRHSELPLSPRMMAAAAAADYAYAVSSRLLPDL